MTNEVKLIEFFGVALKGNNINYGYVAEEGMKRGYIISPECSTEAVLEFLNAQTINPNATFYKDWADIVSKTRFELFLDQIRHYASTYGTNFTQEGNDYVPNDRAQVELPDLTKYKFIGAVTEKEMLDRCMEPLRAGVALKSETAAVLTDYVCKTAKKLKIQVNVDEIKNREAQTIICDFFDIAPTGSFDLLRYIVYKTTGETMIIKNRAFINKIRNSDHKFNFNKLSESQLRNLASIFLRYKDIILAFKHDVGTVYSYGYYGSRRSTTNNNGNAPVINKLRRMADTYHKPLVTPMWSEVLTGKYSLEDVKAHLSEINSYKIVCLMQAIVERLRSERGSLFIIRNGKIFVDASGKRNNSNKINGRFLMDLHRTLYNELVARLSKKACIVKFPKDIDLKFPATEKTFFGNIPFGTEYALKGNNFVGIYWKEEWGTHDFDLHYCGNNEQHVGWNSHFYTGNNSIVFSGDMTRAYPDAAEVMFIGKNAPDGVISLNRYRGNINSKYQLFFGRDDNFRGFRNHQGYMVDPNCIEGKAEQISTAQEQMAAVVSGGKLIIATFDLCNRMVSSNNTLRNELIQAKIRSYVPIKDVLLDAGFVDFDKLSEEKDEDARVLKDINEGKLDILDLTELNKDTIINLMK